MQPMLSILIPTVVGREKQFHKLIMLLCPVAMYDFVDNILIIKYGVNINNLPINEFALNHTENVEIIAIRDNKEMTIGEKRELLYQKANGMYSIMIDDDDSVSDNAITLILEAINGNPNIPCITFREKCMMNGEYKSSNHSIIYDKWRDNFDGYDFVRTPFYKDVIRTDIAKSVPFPKIRYNEDEQWSMAIKPLLTDEIHIDKELYYYIYEPKDTHEERYGIK